MGNFFFNYGCSFFILLCDEYLASCAFAPVCCVAERLTLVAASDTGAAFCTGGSAVPYVSRLYYFFLCFTAYLADILNKTVCFAGYGVLPLFIIMLERGNCFRLFKISIASCAENAFAFSFLFAGRRDHIERRFNMSEWSDVFILLFISAGGAFAA